ncbi:MAG: Hpt domain-containing protein [Cyanobacteria bacterium J06576_12]
MLPEQQQRIMGYFIEEAKDHLNTIEQGLLSLQTTIEDGEKANEVFRAAHSVKGGAAMLGLESIQTIAHRMEDYFKILKESPVTVDSTLETMFLRVSDGLKDLLEQLEGPFGLTPEKAQEIMADVDPVFSQLETHLNSLVAASGTSGGGASVSGSANADAIQVIFKQDVSGLLRQLLSTFKQADTAESRKNLQDVCTQLSAIGQQFELSAWCDLIETARLAAEEPSNEYKVLAPILIKEIKKSQDLVLAGRAFEVGVSETMQALLPDDILATVDTLQNDADNFDSLGLASGDETASEIETELFSESPAVEDDLFADGLFDAEIDTDTEDLNELFGLNSNSAEPLYEGVEPESQLDTNSELEVAEATDEIDINSLSTDGLDPGSLHPDSPLG